MKQAYNPVKSCCSNLLPQMVRKVMVLVKLLMVVFIIVIITTIILNNIDKILTHVCQSCSYRWYPNLVIGNIKEIKRKLSGILIQILCARKRGNQIKTLSYQYVHFLPFEKIWGSIQLKGIQINLPSPSLSLIVVNSATMWEGHLCYLAAKGHVESQPPEYGALIEMLIVDIHLN